MDDLESMGSLTTRHGIVWRIIQLNGRAGYMRESLTVFYQPAKENYVMVDKACQPVFSGTLMDCLDSVRLDLN